MHLLLNICSLRSIVSEQRIHRNIGMRVRHCCFKPCGIRNRNLERVTLAEDEIEALRLMDCEGLYQQECAERMHISRTTFSRTIENARRKIADALVNVKIIQIDTKE